MKRFALIALVAIPLYCLSQAGQLVQSVKAKVIAYINGNLSDPMSYASIQWSELQKETSSYYNSPNRKALLLEIKRLKALNFTSKADSSIIKTKLDTLISIDNNLKLNFVPVTTYVIMHAFTAKSVTGKTDTLVYTFRFDKDLKLLDVDTDSPAKQIEKNRKEIEEDAEYKQLLSGN